MNKSIVTALTLTLAVSLASATPWTDVAVPDGGAVSVVVDQVTGQVTIGNTGPTTAGFIGLNGYTMFSLSDNLDPGQNDLHANLVPSGFPPKKKQAPWTSGWLSMEQAQNHGTVPPIADTLFPAGESWVVDAAPARLSEINTSFFLQDGVVWSLGDAVIPGSVNSPENFAFMYGLYDDSQTQLTLVFAEDVTFLGGGGDPTVDAKAGDDNNAYVIGAHGEGLIGSGGTRYGFHLEGVFDDGAGGTVPGSVEWTISGGTLPGTLPLPTDADTTDPLNPIITFADLMQMGASNRDGTVDYLLTLIADGVESTATLNIPEPATMSLMLFGAIGVIARKRRRN